MKTIKKQIAKLLTLPVLVLLVVLCSSFTKINAQNNPIKLGFIPLTDCSPIVMAKELGLFKKYDVEVVMNKESSWANVRDKILTGELDGAHCLYSMPFSVYTGVSNSSNLSINKTILYEFLFLYVFCFQFSKLSANISWFADYWEFGEPKLSN